MRIREHFKIKGHLVITVTDIDGNVTRQFEVPNTVVNTGKNYIASRMVGTASPVMSKMAIGTSSVAPDVTNIGLLGQLAIVDMSNFAAVDNVITATAAFPPETGIGLITEAGIFDNSVTPVMLCRTTFPVVNKTSLDGVSISWTITVS